MSKQFGIGIYQPKFEINTGTLWRTAYIMGASFIFTIGKRYKNEATDTCRSNYSIPCFNFADFEEFERSRPQQMIIIPVEDYSNATPLQTFKHPKQAVYLLGSENNGLPKYITEKYQPVIIESQKEICLNVHVTGSIVMYDRNIKLK